MDGGPALTAVAGPRGSGVEGDSSFSEYLEKYCVHVCKQDFKFNAAHFVAYRGFRERLHGHNYTVGVRLEAEGIQSDGYVVDFGDIKKVARAVCKELNELFLCPEKSDVLDISVEGEDGGTLRIQCEDGAVRRPLQASGSSRQQPAAKGPCSCSRGACSAGVPFPAAGRSDAADQALDGGGAGALRLYAAQTTRRHALRRALIRCCGVGRQQDHRAVHNQPADGQRDHGDPCDGVRGAGPGRHILSDLSAPQRWCRVAGAPLRPAAL